MAAQIYFLIGTDAVTGNKDLLGTYDDAGIAARAQAQLGAVFRSTYSAIELFCVSAVEGATTQKQATQTFNPNVPEVVQTFLGDLAPKGTVKTKV